MIIWLHFVFQVDSQWTFDILSSTNVTTGFSTRVEVYSFYICLVWESLERSHCGRVCIDVFKEATRLSALNLQREQERKEDRSSSLLIVIEEIGHRDTRQQQCRP